MSSEAGGEVKVLLGPVIGLVNDTTARVLLELDSNVEDLVMTATDTKGKKVKAEASFKKGRPNVFKFEGLLPHMQYDLTLDESKVTVTKKNEEGFVGGFATSNPKDDTQLCIGAVSCNDLRKKEKVGPKHWSTLYDDYVKKGAKKERIALLLHCGDQVYADPAFAEARKILGEGKTKVKDKVQGERIMQLWRQLYRDTWGLPGVQETLANVSNLMIWDDHEIRDDYGFRKEDRDKNSQDFCLAQFARKAYWEYQCQLYMDLEECERNKDHHQAHYHDLDNERLGVIFLDQRTCRSYLYDEDDEFKYLGTEQWGWVKDLIGEDGTFDGRATRALIVITSVPLVFLNTRASTFGSKFGVTDDLGDHWAHKESVAEQVKLIEMLEAWKQRGADEGVNREVLIVGGDVHTGGITDITRDGKVIFRQLTASSIMNLGPSGAPFAALKRAQNAGPHIGPEDKIKKLKKGQGLEFKHGHWTNHPNFGIINVNLEDPAEENTRFAVEIVKRKSAGSKMKCQTVCCCKTNRPLGVNDDETAAVVDQKLKKDKKFDAANVEGGDFAVSDSDTDRKSSKSAGKSSRGGKTSKSARGAAASASEGYSERRGTKEDEESSGEDSDGSSGEDSGSSGADSGSSS